jgi:hypothetical protein
MAIVLAATILGGLLGAIIGFILVYLWYLRVEDANEWLLFVAVHIGCRYGAICGLIGGVIIGLILSNR